MSKHLHSSDSQEKDNQNAIDIRQKKEELKKSREQLYMRQAEFLIGETSRLTQWLQPNLVKKKLRTGAAYLLGRKNLKQLYSKSYRTKDALNQLKIMIDLLYMKGFEDKALQDLEVQYKYAKTKYIKQAIALVLGRYYLNRRDKLGAAIALDYFKVVKQNNILLKQYPIDLFEAECRFYLGEFVKAKKILEHSKDVDNQFVLANVALNVESKLKIINKIYQSYNLEPIQFEPTDGAIKFDDIRVNHEIAQQSGAKVSVILPAYNAEAGIRLAINSILGQTWRNIELIIVDDGSTDRTLEIAKELESGDHRIILLENEKNSGPYISRNKGLSVATGDYVTVQDADDYSHPQRVEKQIKHLENNQHIIANTTQMVRVTEDMDFYRRDMLNVYLFSNMSSLMFRKNQVLDAIGYWDPVRFAADGEYKKRLIKHFGKESVIDLKTGPLALMRQSHKSLTGNSTFGYNGFFVGARKEYVESFTYYHNVSQKNYLPFNSEERAFPVPYPMLPERTEEKRQVDLIIVADFTDLTDEQFNRIKCIIDYAIDKSNKIGLAQFYNYNKSKQTNIDTRIRQLIADRVVEMLVYGEIINAKITIICNLKSLEEKQNYLPLINSATCVVHIEEYDEIGYNRPNLKRILFRKTLNRLQIYFGNHGRWYPVNDRVRQDLKSNKNYGVKASWISVNNWQNDETFYQEELLPWLDLEEI